MTSAHIAFIGAGNMASSMIAGLIGQGHPASLLSVAAPNEKQRGQLANRYDVTPWTDNNQAIAGAEIVVLAVKPQVMAEVCQQLAPSLAPQQLVISVAAGITTQTLQSWLGEQQPVVRCMPNTPAQLGVGISGLFAAGNVSDQQKAMAEGVLNAVGTTLWLEDEAQMDAVTAISGSGPAYFFLLMEAMAAAGEQLGLSQRAALQLTTQTALGAARMALESGLTPEELRRRVTSPKGTTEAAINVLQNGGLAKLLEKATAVAAERSAQLSQTYR